MPIKISIILSSLSFSYPSPSCLTPLTFLLFFISLSPALPSYLLLFFSLSYSSSSSLSCSFSFSLILLPLSSSSSFSLIILPLSYSSLSLTSFPLFYSSSLQTLPPSLLLFLPSLKLFLSPFIFFLPSLIFFLLLSYSSSYLVLLPVSHATPFQVQPLLLLVLV